MEFWRTSFQKQPYPYYVVFITLNSAEMFKRRRWHNTDTLYRVSLKKGNPSFRVHYSIIKNYFFKNVHIIGKLIFSSFIWHHNHDGRVTHDWAGTICTWYGTLTFVQGKWGSYAHVKNHNEPNVAAIHLFWTIGFLPGPLQIVCNRSCVIHSSCLWCHMKEEYMSFPMMCTFFK